MKNDQTNHYANAKGKLIDFFNMLAPLPTGQQKEFTEAWLKETKTLGLDKINRFAELIIKCPAIVTPLLAFMRGVFFCEWAHQSDGKDALFAYERRLPPFKEVIDEPARREDLENETPEMGLHIAMKDGKHSYFLKFPEPGSPVHLAQDLINCLPTLHELLVQHAPKEGLKVLSEAFKQLNFDAGYLSEEGFIESRINSSCFRKAACQTDINNLVP